MTKVIEKPILFSTPMIQAILDGRKTQTRRIIKNLSGHGKIEQLNYRPFLNSFEIVLKKIRHHWTVEDLIANCPHGKVGDRLWVRESFFQYGRWEQANFPGADADDCRWSGSKQIIYRADENLPIITNDPDGFFWRSRPSIHMPRWASRITLEITGIRVELLQDISRKDAIAEGLLKLPATGRYCVNQGDQYFGLADENPIVVYKRLWESINGIESWNKNP